LPVNPIDVLTMTLAAAIAWVLTTGIALGVSFLLVQFPSLTSFWQNAISVVANAVLSAFVVAVASLIPQQYLDQSLFNVAVVILSYVVNWAASFFGATRGLQVYLARHSAKMELVRLQALKA
jgi:small basic protein